MYSTTVFVRSPSPMLRQHRRRLAAFAKTTAGLVDVKLSSAGLFSTDTALVRARVFDTPTGVAFLETLPQEMDLRSYGDEVYGPLKSAPLPPFQRQPMIPPGGLAYSEDGNFLCVFYGQAPAWPVEYIGHIEDWKSLKTGGWNGLIVSRVLDAESSDSDA